MSGGVPAGELLPCPFCGGEAKLVSDTSSTVQCQNDQCIIGDPAPFNDFSHRHDAITAWNTRATPTPPIEGRDADVERENMRWFSDQRRLSLDFYSPMYGDDDDQSEEWRVTKESGPINDREWGVIGRGDTVFAAVAAARAALQALGERG